MILNVNVMIIKVYVINFVFVHVKIEESDVIAFLYANKIIVFVNH